MIIVLQQIRRIAINRDGAFVAQRIFGKSAAKNADDRHLDLLRRFDIVRRVADRDRFVRRQLQAVERSDENAIQR